MRSGVHEIRRSPRRRAAFFDSYLTNFIERDVKELAAIERRGDLRRLLALLAGRPLDLAGHVAADQAAQRVRLAGRFRRAQRAE